MKYLFIVKGISLIAIITILGLSVKTLAQGNPKQIIIRGLVGSSIDSTEKVKYNLFTEYSVDVFNSAQVMRYPSGKMELWIFFKNQSFKKNGV